MPYVPYVDPTNNVSTVVAQHVKQPNDYLGWLLPGEFLAGEYGAKGDGTTDDSTALANMDIANAGNGRSHLTPTTGRYRLSVSKTLSYATRFDPGAIVKPDSGKTLTINGPIDAGAYQIFDLSAGGAIVCGPGAVRSWLPEWFGARPDGSTDNATAFGWLAAAVNASGNPAVVEFRPGTYKYASGLAFTVPVTLRLLPGAILNYTGTGVAISMGPTGLTSGTLETRLYALEGGTLTGGASMTAGVQFNRWLTLCAVRGTRFVDFGNTSAANIQTVGQNWSVSLLGVTMWSLTVAYNVLLVNDANDDSGQSQVRINDNCVFHSEAASPGYGLKLNGVSNEIAHSQVVGFSYNIILRGQAARCRVHEAYFECLAGTVACIGYGDASGDTGAVVGTYIPGLRIDGCYANMHHTDAIASTAHFLAPRSASTGIQFLRVRDTDLVAVSNSIVLIAVNTANGSQIGNILDSFQTDATAPTLYTSGATFVRSPRVAYLQVASTWTLTSDNTFVGADGTTAAFTITLPPVASVQPGDLYTIIKLDSAAHTITVSPNTGDGINGSGAQSLTTQYQVLRVRAGGPNAWLIA